MQPGLAKIIGANAFEYPFAYPKRMTDWGVYAKKNSACKHGLSWFLHRYFYFFTFWYITRDMANLRSLLAALVLLLMIAIDRPFHSPPIIPIGAAYAAEALPPAHHHSPHDERRKSDDDGSTTGQVVTVVAGYLPDYRDYVNINASSIFLTDIMLFSITPETIFHEYSPHVRGEGGGGGGGGGKCCLSSRHYATMRRARSYGKEERRRRRRRSSTIAANSSSDDENIRILVTIGGGGRSEGFREVVMGNEEYQSRFTRGMVQLW
jgi:hypothetical protein